MSQWRRNETVVEKNVPKRQPGNQHSRPPSPLRTPDNVQVAAGVWHHQVIRGFLDGAEERDRDLAALLTEIQHGGGILTPAFIAGVLP